MPKAPYNKPVVDSGYLIGTYYYPGWKDNEVFAVSPTPWQKIVPYPEREPSLGWYPEGEVSIAEQHLSWMKSRGIDFVAYDWYWLHDNKTYLSHALNAYLRANNQSQVKFTLLWANHGEFPKTIDNFVNMVRFWSSEYFHKQSYLQIDGRPVVIIFGMDYLNQRAIALGTTPKALISKAQEIARSFGYPGIFFVGGTNKDTRVEEGIALTAGVDAVTAYNYHWGVSKEAESYAELAAGYKAIWNAAINKSPLPYLVPMTSGWDRRPWGGSKNPKHDNCVSTPESFENHLREAKAVIDANPTKTLRIGMICCWNEFGEGSYIEPTRKWGTQYIDKVQDVFGDASAPK